MSACDGTYAASIQCPGAQAMVQDKGFGVGNIEAAGIVKGLKTGESLGPPRAIRYPPSYPLTSVSDDPDPNAVFGDLCVKTEWFFVNKQIPNVEHAPVSTPQYNLIVVWVPVLDVNQKLKCYVKTTAKIQGVTSDKTDDCSQPRSGRP